MPRTAVLAALALSLGAVPALAQPDGKQLYDLQCSFCHADESLGPSLAAVAGRKIGSGSFAFSEAMKAKGDAGATWTDEELDAFLKDPAAHTPGTTMVTSVTDDANRAAIVAYLKTLK